MKNIENTGERNRWLEIDGQKTTAKEDRVFIEIPSAVLTTLATGFVEVSAPELNPERARESIVLGQKSVHRSLTSGLRMVTKESPIGMPALPRELPPIVSRKLPKAGK